MKGLKVLIADDEKLARYGLRSMLEELGVPARSISSVADGLAMVEEAARGTPDVAFVDIRMPRLDGLAGIERGRRASPGTRWIILTSHSSFAYARRALELDAEEYLLKPVSPEELGRVLDRVEAERRAELSRSNDEFESRVSALLNDTQSVSEGPQGFIREARLLGAVVVFDGSVPGEDLRERQRAACRGIRERLSSAVDPRRRTALTALADGALALLCAWLPGPDGAVQRESAASLLKSVQAWLDGACREDIRATVIQTAECSGFPAARRELEEASRLAAQRVLLGVGRLLSLEEARAAARGRDASLSAALERAALAWEAGNRLEFSAGIAAARRALADGALASGGRAAGEAGLQPAWGNLVRFLGAAFGFRPEAGRQPWLDALEAHGAALADSRGAGGGLVEQVVSFVQANFADNGGIGAIAGRLGVTPNYLSSLFHRSQGVTFVRYVTGLRMEEAQRLLAAGARVRDAARAVGYASTRHFSTLFFRHFGRHPSQRRSHAPGRPKSEKIAPEE